jgi:signal transduction histidine kinase
MVSPQFFTLDFLSRSRGWFVRIGPAAVWLGLALARAWADGSAEAHVGNTAGTNENYAFTNQLGSWIWAETTSNQQTCQLWRVFDIPKRNPVAHARVLMTADDEYTLYLDGRELGRAADWRELQDYDVTPLMSPGTHTLAVKAYNSFWFAGMIFGLHVDFADGKTLDVKSDRSWKIVPAGERKWTTKKLAPKTWPEATIIAPLGGDPWWKVPVRIDSMPTLQPIRVYFWQTGWFQVALLSLCGVVILVSLRLLAQLASHRQEEQLLQKERARIARDFHDDLGARMTRLVVQGEVTLSELPAESATRRQIDGLCEEARRILATMDEILWAVNPKRDTFRDFISYIGAYAQEFFKATRIHCWFDLDPAASSAMLSLPLKRALLMAVKETLNNVVKHSEATEVVLQVKWLAPRLLVAISDNGKGFDKAAVTPGRNGLTNMAERMTELGGTCSIVAEPGKGCRTEFSLPLKDTRPAARRFMARWRRFWKPATPAANAPANPVLQTHDSFN